MSRKRKQKGIKGKKLTILLGSLVLAIFIVNYNFILRFIDKQIINCQYICNDGWVLKNNVCYQYREITEQKFNAYIIGDIDGSSLIDQNDYNAMLKYFAESMKWNHNDIVIYDMNQDKIVNEKDLNILKILIEKSDSEVQYICPNKLIQSLNDKNNTTITTTYALNDTYCTTKVVERIEKKASQKCNDVSTKYDVLKYHK